MSICELNTMPRVRVAQLQLDSYVRNTYECGIWFGLVLLFFASLQCACVLLMLAFIIWVFWSHGRSIARRKKNPTMLYIVECGGDGKAIKPPSFQFDLANGRSSKKGNNSTKHTLHSFFSLFVVLTTSPHTNQMNALEKKQQQNAHLYNAHEFYLAIFMRFGRFMCVRVW